VLAQVGAELEGHPVAAGELQVRQVLAGARGHRRAAGKTLAVEGAQPLETLAAGAHHIGGASSAAKKRCSS
jgi:hypothetical protein